MKKYIKFLVIIFISLFFSVILCNNWQNYFYPITVSIQFKSDKDDICQLFYDIGKGFNQIESICIPYKLNDDFKVIKFELPTKKFLNLRIDPGLKSTKYIINNIKFQVGTQSKIYSGNNILKNFEVKNLIKFDSLTETNLCLNQTIDLDVQMKFSSKINEIFILENTKAKYKILLLLIIFYISLLITIILFGFKIYYFLKKQIKLILSYNSQINYSSIIQEYFKKNKEIIIYSLLIAIFSYGYELFNFSLSIDEEVDSFQIASSNTIYLVVGRWGLFYLNQLINPQSVIPYLPTLIALICIAFSSVLFISSEKGNLTSKLIFSIIFISHPIHSYYLAFNTSGMYYTIGMVAILFGYLAFKELIKDEKFVLKYFSISILMLVFALSIYQALLSFFIVLIIFYLFNLYSEINENTNLKFKKTFVYFLLVSGISLFIYKFFDILLRYLILGKNYIYKTEYLDTFIGWGKQSFFEIFNVLINLTKGYFLDLDSNIGIIGVSSKFVILLIPFIIFFIFKFKISALKKILLTLILTSFILAPFTIMYINGAPLPTRALMSFPFMIAILWWYAYINVKPILKKIMIILVCFILINNTYINTRLFYASYTSWQADRDIANRIIERIYNLNPPIKQGKISVSFFGNYKQEQNVLFLKSDVHGASFFNWGEESNFRIKSFYKTIGINELEIIRHSKLSQYTNKIKLLPCWPEKGSVALFNDVVIVKLSN